MYNLKKVLLGVFTIALTFFAGTIAVSADVTSNEQRIIDALNGANVPANYVTLARQHLARADVELDIAAVDSILSYINEAKTLVEGSSLSAVLADSTQANRLATLIVNAGRAADLTVQVNLENLTASTVGGVTLNALINGSKSTSDVIRNTGGSDYTLTMILVAGLVSLLGVTTIVAKKKELF